MPRRYYAGGGGLGAWPYMYIQQPGGWAEQTYGMGYGHRPSTATRPPNSANTTLHDLLFSSSPLAASGSTADGGALTLDALSALFTRLILQNHLVKLAGDALGGMCRSSGNGGGGGGALWGCNIPHTSAQHHTCGVGGGGQTINNSSSSSSCCVCHTCPAATRPYMGPNNVFVIPAGNLQNQQQPNAAFGNLNLNNNNSINNHNLNMFLSGLGLAMGAAGSGCASVGGAGGLNLPFSIPVFGTGGGGGLGGPVSLNGLGFNCSRCNFKM